MAADVRVASASGAVADTAALAALSSGSLGVLFIASLTHRFSSAVLTHGVLLECVRHRLWAPLPRLLWSYGFGAPPIATCPYVFGPVIVTRGVADMLEEPALGAISVTAASAALVLSCLWRSVNCSRIASAQQPLRAAWLQAYLWHHLWLLSLSQKSLSTVKLLYGRARGISYAWCCLDCHFGGAAFEPLWRSVDRPVHTPREFSSAHAQHDC